MKRDYRKSRYARSIVNGVRFWLIMVVLVSSIGPVLVSADVVWEDNFDDGNYDGWTICDNLTLLGGDYGFSGSTWDATNKYLECTDAPDNWGIISHPSDVAYGTWSFDFKDNNIQSRSGDTAMVVFISNSLYDLDEFVQDSLHYWIDFDVPNSENFTISLIKRSGGFRRLLNSTIVPAVGWHHFNVTRNTTGWFSVYHNGFPIIELEDTEIVTSTMFWLWFKEGQMIDNIVVDDEIRIPHSTTTTTTTSTTPTDGGFDITMILLVGGGIAAIVVIVLVVWKLRGRT